MRGVAAGVACVAAADLVHFGCGEAVVAVPLDVLPFLLLDCHRLVRTCWPGVCCRGVGVDTSATCPSAVMAATISSSCLASAGVFVTLAAEVASSVSTRSISSFEAGGVAIFFLPLPEMTGIRGSFSGFSSSSSWIMCLFLVLEGVLMEGSSRSFSDSSFASVGEPSVADSSPSSSGWSDGSASSDSTSTYGSAAASFFGSSVAVASSLASAGAPVVLVSKLYCWSNESGKFW